FAGQRRCLDPFVRCARLGSGGSSRRRRGIGGRRGTAIGCRRGRGRSRSGLGSTFGCQRLFVFFQGLFQVLGDVFVLVIGEHGDKLVHLGRGSAGNDDFAEKAFIHAFVI